ncbi:SDR family oxidoreductase [Candidatus Dojkabacteria bacterium]|jgi:NAD(P)-dependent dehydrogenase (short-subunit alcohol dehydrogenase family)|nr:SDR family oxidoreductase [Candidatus Dojkabacteria bacterium]
MKKVLITGISRGIGNATAKILASEGYYIIGTFNTNKDLAQKLKDEIKNIDLYQVDLSDRKQTKIFLEKIKSEKLYAIINNAGILNFEQWDEFTMENWDKTLEVNLSAPMLICHTLRNSIDEGGVIVNISSTDGLKGALASIVYSVSKAGLTNLSLSLANVFGPKKVRVISLSPGWIGDGMGSPVIEDAKWFNPLSRTAEYEEIANAVSLLLSDKASFINGTNFIVDGGSMAVDYCLKKENDLTKKQ